jgi:RNA polymerase sigma-70 factor (ECF subfamily)
MSDASLEKTISATMLSDSALSRERHGFLTEIYQSYWPDLCRYINKTFGAGPPDPEDVAQQAFINFARHENSQGIANPRAYLYRTAHNIAVDQLRRARTRHQYLVDGAHKVLNEQSCHLTGEHVLLKKQQLQIVRAALLEMPRKRRRFLLLHRVHGLSFAEIGRRMHMSPQGIGKHVRRALKELEEALEAAEGQDRFPESDA